MDKLPKCAYLVQGLKFANGDQVNIGVLRSLNLRSEHQTELQQQRDQISAQKKREKQHAADEEAKKKKIKQCKSPFIGHNSHNL